MDWPFGNLAPFSFDMLMVDPPWQFENWSKKGEEKNASAKYDCMDLDAIKALPVGHLASQNSILWLWATNPLLREAFQVIDAWGFRYVTAGTWVKTTKTGKIAFGTGYVLRSANEPFLIAANGSPTTVNNVRSVIMAEAREHSRKPDEAFHEAERLVPDARRIELFSRQSRPGWETWGNEAGKFDESEAA